VFEFQAFSDTHIYLYIYIYGQIQKYASYKNVLPNFPSCPLVWQPPAVLQKSGFGKPWLYKIRVWQTLTLQNKVLAKSGLTIQAFGEN
jgi:hypothetical protein